VRHVARAVGLDDTTENRERLEPLRAVIAALIRAEKDPAPYLDELLAGRTDATPQADDAPAIVTVASYFREWIATKKALVRKAQLRDYDRHFRRYILPRLGGVPLSELRPRDIRGLQSELLTSNSEKTKKPLSVKTVKNVISGSLRAMITQAVADEEITRELFAGVTWPAWSPPEPDPFSEEERDTVLRWFAGASFGFPAAAGSTKRRWLPHPPFHAYVHVLFWNFLRPSEASGLWWGDVDLEEGLVYVRRSRHSYEYGAPKTRSARRTVELHPETAHLLRAVQPVRCEPTTPVFLNTMGTLIEPKNFSEHWYRALRSLGLRMRGLYTTKATAVTPALRRGVRIEWLEAQTGVAYATLRKHYARWWPSEDRADLRLFAGSVPGTARSVPGRDGSVPGDFVSARKVVGSEVRGGGLEPPQESRKSRKNKGP
jgi:integrase